MLESKGQIIYFVLNLFFQLLHSLNEDDKSYVTRGNQSLRKTSAQVVNGSSTASPSFNVMPCELNFKRITEFIELISLL